MQDQIVASPQGFMQDNIFASHIFLVNVCHVN